MSNVNSKAQIGHVETDKIDHFKQAFSFPLPMDKIGLAGLSTIDLLSGI